MAKHEQLHKTLRAAAQLLDIAATQVRDLPLDPTKENIRLIGEALACVFQVRHQVEARRPDLAKQYEPATEEESLANRRLGEAMVAADELSEVEGNEAAQLLLERFAEQEPSSFHRDIALLQATRYRLRDGT